MEQGFLKAVLAVIQESTSVNDPLLHGHYGTKRRDVQASLKIALQILNKIIHGINSHFSHCHLLTKPAVAGNDENKDKYKQESNGQYSEVHALLVHFHTLTSKIVGPHMNGIFPMENDSTPISPDPNLTKSMPSSSKSSWEKR